MTSFPVANRLLPAVRALQSCCRRRPRRVTLHGCSTRRCQLVRHLSSSSSSVQHSPVILNPGDVEYFRNLLDNDTNDANPTSAVVTREQDASLVHNASTDWTGHYSSQQTPLVLQPRTVEHVSSILQYCHDRGLAVVPQAGKTGLVGGSVPKYGHELVLQLGKLNAILPSKDDDASKSNNIVKCQAGVILQDLQEYCAEKRNLLVPIDLGSKGTCQIGGNLATNAGGQYYYRYQSLAANVIGLQAVLANGSIVDWNFESKCNRKDNTGYKLHQLLIGSEGTLGIITGVALSCPPLPQSRQAAFVICESYNQVMQVMNIAKQELGEILAAMELMDASIWNLVGDTGNHRMPPLTTNEKNSNSSVGDKPFFVLMETHGANPDHDQAKMETFLERCMEQNYVQDGVLAQDLHQLQEFWKIRESANPTVASLGYTYKYDVSLPSHEFDDWIQEMKKERLSLLGEGVAVNTNWGHVLDGNLHYNVTTIGEFERQQNVVDCLEPYLFESILRRGGSISAEHGLGQSKNHLLTMVHDETTLELMRSLKNVFDPKGILNPGKFLPP